MDISLRKYAEEYGIEKIVNDYGETRRTYITDYNQGRIIFSNLWCASIVSDSWVASIVSDLSCPQKGAYSVAMCDYNGYFDWSILDEYGADNGFFYCDTEDQIIAACEVIRNITKTRYNTMMNYQVEITD